MIDLLIQNSEIVMVHNNISSISYGGDYYSIDAHQNNFLFSLQNARGPHNLFENYYIDYYEMNKNISRTKDRVHWIDPYRIREWPVDINPLIFPWGYNGSREPVFLKDNTPSTVIGGSPFNFSVDLWDMNAVRNLFVTIDIGFDTNEVLMVEQGTGYNWSLNYTAPLNVSIMEYSFHALSIAGYWSNTSMKAIDVNDVTRPFITVLSDRIGTTGDPFEFKANVTDNIGISHVWIDIWRNGTSTVSLEMFKEDDWYRTTMVLPTYRIDPLYYRIRAEDLSGNNVTTPIIKADVQDNDWPTPIVPLVTFTYTGVNTTLDGSRCTDNIGIVGYYWDIYDVEGKVRIEGMMPTYVFKFPGAFMIVLMVKDAANNAQWAVIYVNVSNAPVGPPPHEELFINLIVGKVVDNDTVKPLEGVRIVMQIEDDVYFNETDAEGYAFFVIPRVWAYRDVSMTMRKEGYQNQTFDTILSPEGNFQDDAPRMYPIKVKEADPPFVPPLVEDLDSGNDWWLLIAIVVIAILALIAGVIWVYALKGSKRSSSEE
jgi:hypothetical protein